MTKIISPEQVAATLSELWSPRIVGAVDDSYIKVAKIKGTFTWHAHDNEDELFFVLKGSMQIEMEQETVQLNVGDLFIVPKGVRHKPSADEECHILLIERKSTLHTGDVTNNLTRSIEEQLNQN
jgi:mannose-6-phosphate isomerase-like protein (cupin superfamily)